MSRDNGSLLSPVRPDTYDGQLVHAGTVQGVTGRTGYELQGLRRGRGSVHVADGHRQEGRGEVRRTAELVYYGKSAFTEVGR